MHPERAPTATGLASGGSGPVREPLHLTVHSLPPADARALAAGARRSGRLQMLLVLLVCAAPVIASYFTYFVVRPQGGDSYGSLITPTRPMPTLEARTPEGRAEPLASLAGQWLIVALGPGRCEGACEKRLYLQRQLREMLGAERDRVDKLWLVTDGEQPSASLLSALAATPAMVVRLADRDALRRWLEPAPGHPLEDHLYLVDPMGRWMMRFPADPDPQRMRRDLDRLLRASASWDRAGR